MSSLMNRLLCTYVPIFCCFTLACVYGRGQDSIPSCEVELRVRRGRTLKVPPRQRVTVKCPVKYCGESVNVTWCKLLDSGKCEQINDTETVQLTDKHLKDELISFLTFKRISIHDDGLYRCYLKGLKEEIISHAINISVSNSTDHWVKNPEDIQDESKRVAVHKDLSWLPYFYICGGIALLVATLTALTFLFTGRKGSLTFNHKQGQERSNHMIPALPKETSPSSPSLYPQIHFPFHHDIHLPSAAGRPSSHPPHLMTDWNQAAVANTAGGQQAPKRAVYSAIKHQQA